MIVLGAGRAATTRISPARDARTFAVVGDPVPQGSKKYVGHRRGKPVLVESAKGLNAWRDAIVARYRLSRFAGHAPFEDGVDLHLIFTFRKPKGKRREPSVRPDLDKLARAVCDALKTAGAYRDDGQVVCLHAVKRYAVRGGEPSVSITVAPSYLEHMRHEALLEKENR